MEALPNLTPTLALLLRAAARHAGGRVISPDNLRGVARVKALSRLLRHEWIEAGDAGYMLTDAGYAAAGRKRSEQPEGLQSVEPPDDLQLLEGIPVCPSTKLTTLVVALRHPQGAINLQLMLATGWQPHSARGAISSLRKRLGLNVVLTHNAAGERVYRIG
jgi:hypothetical protein